MPAGLADTTTFRVAARTLGDRGYIFFSNYLRGHHMAEQIVRVALTLPGETVVVPSVVASGAYGIWPVNTRIGSALLKYSTAQLVTRTAGARRCMCSSPYPESHRSLRSTPRATLA